MRISLHDCRGVFSLTGVYAICLFSWHLSSYAQQKTFDVTFKRIYTQGDSIAGEKPDFPYPVISVMTVQDDSGRYVHNLGKKNQWLTGDDSTASGKRLEEIWKNIRELYYAQGQTVPDRDHDVTDYRVKELRNVEGFGLSVVLIMDYSYSMGDSILVAEDAARNFIRKINPGDSVAIIKFTGKVKLFQDFTDDSTALNETISEPTTDREFTALYDAVFTGIRTCRDASQAQRKVVIAYTDGIDNFSSHPVDEIIQEARKDTIPIYMIGLGDELEEQTLKKIAEGPGTGGKYYHAPSAGQLESIYDEISGMLQSWYVLAHRSPEPCTDSTYRKISLTVELDEVSGNGSGTYRAPFIPTDVYIDKTAVTDKIWTIGGKQVPVFEVGDSARFEIRVMNDGPKVARDIVVSDRMIDAFAPYGMIAGPDSVVVQDGVFYWSSPLLEPGDTLKIVYQGFTDTLAQYELTPYTNRATVTEGCLTDVVSSNNSDSVTVYYSPPDPPDLSIYKSAISDSLVVSGEDSLWYVHPSDTVIYKITVVNEGDRMARDIRIRDIIPQELHFLEFPQVSHQLAKDTLAWTLASLAPHTSGKTFVYACVADTFMLPSVKPLVNYAEVFCDQDTHLANNTASDICYYVPLIPPDIGVYKRAEGDSLVVLSGDSTWYVHPGQVVTCSVNLINHGEIAEENIQVQDILPGFVTLTGFQGGNYTQSGDTLFWQVAGLEPRGKSVAFLYTCRVDSFMPPWNVPLINQVTISSTGDTVLYNNSDADTVIAVALIPPDPQIRLNPAVIQPGDSVEVEVMTPVDVEQWDLIAGFENGTQDDLYADAFISRTRLAPAVWTLVRPDFVNTWMVTDKDEEKVAIVFETVDIWNVVRSDTAYFQIVSSDEFFLDENAYRPREKSDLGMRFKLSSNRYAEIIVYDVSGAFVSKVWDGPAYGGWNTTQWDGRDDRGVARGSGIYIAILKSGAFQKARKFVLVR